MSVTAVGTGISAVEEVDDLVPPLTLVPEAVDNTAELDLETVFSPLMPVAENPVTQDIVAAMREEMAQTIAAMREENAAAVADVERRLAQAREIEQATAATVATGGTYVAPRSVHAEDLNIGRPLLDGYLMTANSPVAGSISWSSLHVVLLGVDYTITDGSTSSKYTWFIKPASGTTATLVSGNTLPVLSSVDALIFVNNNGVPISALETAVSYAVGAGVIGQAQLATDVSTILSTLQSNDIALQSAIDGSITTYAQDTAPWPSGSPSPAGGNINQGDVWYDMNDGGAFRWTGTGGSPANTWLKIADTDNSALAGKIAIKTTTYLANNAATPVAPTGGFTTGDLWMVLDQGNMLRRWSGTAWVDLQIGDGAISGVGGAKVGTGINATNITTGTVSGARVGTGINAANVDNGTLAAARVGPGVAGAVLNSATGTVGNSQIAVNAVQPKNINAAFHLLY
jgi:hypothetical protein